MAKTPGYIKKRFNVSKWVGYDQVKHNATLIKQIAKPNKNTEEKIRDLQAKRMSFEELIQANQWSPNDIKKNIKHQKRMSLCFLGFAALLLLLAIYLFAENNIFGGIFTLVFILLGVAYAYQAWVSYEQLTQQKIRIAVKASFIALFKKKR